MIHPSLIQKISLDERQASQDIVEDLKRSYNYVGPISVARHAAADPACNVFQMIVRMSKPYWRSSDPQGDAMWAEVNSWLVNKLYKVGSTMVNYNASHREDGRALVEYGCLELEMKEMLFGFALPDTDELPAVNEQVARYRELLNEGVFEGLDVVSIDIPSRQSYAEQYDAARAAADAESQAQAQDETAENNVQLDGDSSESGTDNTQVDAADETTAQSDGDAAETAQAPAAKPAVLTAVDYRVWGVVCADGSVRTFDSVAAAWL